MVTFMTIFVIIHLVVYFVILYQQNTPIIKLTTFQYTSECKIEQSRTETTVITLFTTFKEREDRKKVHSLVVKNWASLKPFVRPVLFSTSVNGYLIDQARKYKWDILPVPRTNKFGTPFIKGMYSEAYNTFESDFYAYANGDLLFSDKLVHSLREIIKFKHLEKRNNYTLSEPFIVGQRSEVILDNDTKKDIWKPHMVEKTILSHMAKLHWAIAIDYFITTHNGFPWSQVPDLVIGRAAYDQYILLQARYHNLTTFDITRSNPVIHLKGPHNHMTHFSDHDKDGNFNNKIIKKLHPKGVPWTAGVITATEYFTKVAKNDKLHVCRRKHYKWPFRGPQFDKYRNLTINGDIEDMF